MSKSLFLVGPFSIQPNGIGIQIDPAPGTVWSEIDAATGAAPARAAAPYVPGVSTASTPETNTAPPMVGPTGAVYSREVTATEGGVVSVPYPQGNQQLTLIHGIVQDGLYAFDLGTVAAIGDDSHWARFTLTQVEAGTCTAEMALATERGVFVGPSVISNGPAAVEPSIIAEGSQVKGKPLYLNARFVGAATPADVYLRIEAHDRY